MRIMRNISQMENLRPRTLAELSKELGISKQTACKYRKILRDVGTIIPPKLEDGTKWYFASPENFRTLDIIKEFITQLKFDKLLPTTSISPLYQICKATDTHPEDLKDSIRKAEIIYAKFVEIWKRDNPDKLLIKHDKAMRKFLKFLGHNITNTHKTFYADDSVGGDYASTRLTDKEFQLGLEFMEKEGGNEYKNLFGIHHETFVRPITLFKTLPKVEMQFLEVAGKTLEYAQLSVVESKQGVRYDKLILHPKVVDMTFELKANQMIVSDKKEIAEKKYANLLRGFYHEIGKLDSENISKRGEEGWLYQNRPLYTIRHSSAHMWMRRTNYNADLVASMGWEDSKTLLKFYSRVSTKSIMSAGVCQYCRPPIRETNEFSFCSASHAVAYLNGMRT